jgi:monoamine oxidase
MSSVIIIGAGASGLTAARALSKKGKQVIVIEARDRVGGRTFTAMDNGFSSPVEHGAEFIHGDLPHTQQLAKEAGISFREGNGRQYSVESGKKEEGEFFDTGWDKFIGELKKLDHDISIAQFLNEKFGGKEYESLRQSVIRFVQGFDAADANKASSFALRQEWTETDATTGYHLIGGYTSLMEYLYRQCQAAGVKFHLSSPVTEIYWNRGRVAVNTQNGERFDAEKILITIPPAVLRSGRIKIFPEIREQQAAIEKIETGGVIKFLFEFTEAVWEKDTNKDFRKFPEAHFIFSDAYVPTWWTQRPANVPLLTGWLSGPVTKTISLSEGELLSEGIKSLGYIFDCPVDKVKSMIRASKVVNWVSDPYSLGAYAYKTVETSKSIELLTKGVDDTVFFAGEAYHTGPEMGTVEAALVTGEEAGKKM